MVLPLVVLDALGGIDALSEDTFLGLITTGSEATLPDSSPLLDQLIFLVTLLLNQVVLSCHLALELLILWLFEKVFFGRKFWNRSVSCKHYLFPLGTIHVVELVLPGVLVLGLLLAITSTPLIVVTSISTAWSLALLVDSFGSISCLSGGLWATTTSNSDIVVIIGSSLAWSSTSTASTATGSLWSVIIASIGTAALCATTTTSS